MSPRGSNRRLRADYEQHPKGVCQYSTAGELIKQFPSIAEASREVGISVSRISQCCTSKRIALGGGFVWRFVGEPIDGIIRKTAMRGHVDAVRQYTLKGEFIAEYPNISSAQEVLCDKSLNIYFACKQVPGFEVAGGYLWRFSNIDDLAERWQEVHSPDIRLADGSSKYSVSNRGRVRGFLRDGLKILVPNKKGYVHLSDGRTTYKFKPSELVAQIWGS